MAEETPRRSFGHKMVDAIHEARVRSRAAELPLEHDARAAWLTALAERHEREMAPTTKALYAELLELDELPAGFRTLIEQATEPTHVVDFLLNIILTVAGAAANAGAITQPYVQRAVNASWKRHPDRPLDPEELAVAVVKGWRAFDEAYDGAAESGISEADFETLVDSTGEPPGVMDMLAMHRRGIIDQATLLKGIRESRLKLEWAAPVEAYAYGPPSAASAILGAVQNHLDDATARKIVQQNGIAPENYDWLYQNAGRPPGVMQMIDAMHRGAFGWDVVDQAIRESDIKNKYIPAYHSLGEHLLPQKTVVAGVHQGVITDAKALELLLKLGISPENAGYLIQEGHNNKTAAHKQLSVSQISIAYEEGALSRDQARTHLIDLNYQSADADFVLDLVDIKWAQALHSATITRIRSLYLGHHLDRSTASADLDSAGVTPAHRDAYLRLWDIVRTTPTRTLTEAQLASAYKKGLITEQVFRSRLTAMGYPEADVDLLVLLNPVPPAAPARR